MIRSWPWLARVWTEHGSDVTTVGVSVGVALSHKLHVLCNLLWGNNGKSIAVC